jgi:hypothetical protein
MAIARGGKSVIDREAPGGSYQTSIDRAGLALATGGALGGIVTMVLVALGGHDAMLALLDALLIGAVFSTLGIAAVAAPIWLAMHAAGWRGPIHAASGGAALSFVLFFGAATRWFGFNGDIGDDGAAPLLHWLRAAGSSMILAAAAALIALVMWRVAYRRTG